MPDTEMCVNLECKAQGTRVGTREGWQSQFIATSVLVFPFIVQGLYEWLTKQRVYLASIRCHAYFKRSPVDVIGCELPCCEWYAVVGIPKHTPHVVLRVTIQLKHAHIFGGSLYPVPSFSIFLGGKILFRESSCNQLVQLRLSEERDF